MNEKLKPCPFCNGEPMIKCWEDEYPKVIAQISCQNCSAKQRTEGARPTYDKVWCLAKAYEEWNTRQQLNLQEVEKLFPDGDTTNKAVDDYGFRVPYDGSNKFYDEDAMKHFLAGVRFVKDHIKEALTDLEAKGGDW